ncbi:MAG: aldehyde dehydrogenase family protein [Candidatus Aminicenantes bacterium]|nr:aldehyde dehydrogenase family protein [Candidatus Aminicenantes bacterium]
MKEYKLLINGKWAKGAEKRDIKSPYDGKAAAQVHFGDKSQVESAVAQAHEAFDRTKELSSGERAQALENISENIEKREQELAESIVLGAGKPIKSSRVEVSRAVNTFQIAAEEAKRINGEIIPLDLMPQTEKRWGFVRRFPIGVIAGITPFNFPLNLVAHKVAPALAAGNTFVSRPASQVSITDMILADIINESGYPAGGFNAVPCGHKAADALIENKKVKMVTFTGSPDIGWELKKRAHKKIVTLELGGNAAVVIEPDANLDYALPRTVLGAYAYSGQICISIQRVYVHEKIYDRFMADFVESVKNLTIGDPMKESTDVGPMINVEAAEQTEEWLEEAINSGARIVCGGKRDGAMFEPTVITECRPDLRISWLEAFAPVAVVYRYKEFEEALGEVNNSIYGLQAGVFTSDLNKAFRAYDALDVGGVIVNDIPTFRIDHMPYGGIKESGFGREGLKYAIEEMTEMKLMALNLKI